MTYAEALVLRPKLEAAIAAGQLSVSSASADNARSLTYKSNADIRLALNQVNRDILNYQRDNAGQTNPGVKTPAWNT